MEKIERTYIESSSKLQQYRKEIALGCLIIMVIAVIIVFVNISLANYIMIAEISFLVIGGLIVKVVDYLSFVKPKEIFQKSYKQIKLSGIKESIKETLKENSIYNIESIESILYNYQGKVKQYNTSENVKWIISIVISIISLTKTSLMLAIGIVAAIIICWLIKNALDFSLDYVLTIKVNYSEVCDILTEIKLDIIKEKNKIKNKKAIKSNHKGGNQ